MPTRLTRRKFLKLATGATAALGLGAVPVAEAEAAEREPDTLLGLPIEWTDSSRPETALLGPAPAEMKIASNPIATFKDGILYVTYATMAPDATVKFRYREEHRL